MQASAIRTTLLIPLYEFYCTQPEDDDRMEFIQARYLSDSCEFVICLKIHYRCYFLWDGAFFMEI